MKMMMMMMLKMVMVVMLKKDDDIDNDDAHKEKMCLGQYRAIQCGSFVYSQLNRRQVVHRNVQCSVYCTQDQPVMSLCVLHCNAL